MKKITTLMCFCYVISLIALTSCSNENDEESSSSMYTLSLNASVNYVNTIDSKAVYPIEVYAYNSEGEEKGHVTIESEEQLNNDAIDLTLTTGTYTIVAVSGDTDFLDNSYHTAPLMLGKQTVTISKSDITASISLSYAVAQVDFELTDVPESSTNVTVTLSSLYSEISSTGELSGTTDVTIPCVKDDNGVWRTDTVYVLPTNAEYTNITITHTTTKDGETVSTDYNTTYSSPLVAATPYHFRGKFSSDDVSAKVQLSLYIEGWNDDIEHEFEFGPGVGEVIDENVTGTTETTSSYTTSSVPEVASKWNDHVIAAVTENTEIGGYDVILCSTQTWTDVSPAVDGAPDITQAATIAAEYQEDDITGWSIPTLEEVNTIGLDLNTVFSAIQKGLDYKTRFLCDDATRWYSISYRAGGSADAETTYYLRLVKKIHMVVK